MFSLTNFSYILIFGTVLVVYAATLIAIAYYTLFERKVMSNMQRRVGPNVIGFNGILQPFADALKLIIKETITPKDSNKFFFYLGPLLTFSLSITTWLVIPFNSMGAICNSELGILLIFAISSLNVYGIIFSGWASNNKYALIGSFRSVAQMISYEVVFSFVAMPILIFTGSSNIIYIGIIQEFEPFYSDLAILSPIFIILIIAETNRAPFDLPEAEAELVAGYNVEYSSLSFAIFFLAEYSSMSAMSALLVILYLGAWNFSLHNFNKIIYTSSLKTIKNVQFDLKKKTKLSSISGYQCYLFETMSGLLDKIKYSDKLVAIKITDESRLYLPEYQFALKLKKKKSPLIIKNIEIFLNTFGGWTYTFNALKPFKTYKPLSKTFSNSINIIHTSQEFGYMENNDISWTLYIFYLDKLTNLENTSICWLESLTLGLKIILISFIFIWVRATFPRYRFDQLLLICWKYLLPFTFSLIIFYSSMFYIYYTTSYENKIFIIETFNEKQL